MSVSFGTVLKDWRLQRRVSQLDLALSADVSSRHISFLETGRSQPSRSMVMRLCDELDVPRQARNLLMSSAGLAPAYASRALSEDDMAPAKQAVVWMLERHAPFPALAMDRHWNVTELNSTAQQLLLGMDVCVGDSLLNALTQNEKIREAIVNLDEVVAHTIVRLRTESAHFGGDPILEEAIAKLQHHEGTSAYDSVGLMPAFVPARYKLNGQEFSFFSTFTVFGSAEDITLSEMKIEMMFPADEQTREFLKALI